MLTVRTTHSFKVILADSCSQLVAHLFDLRIDILFSFARMRSTDLEELFRASLHHMTVRLDIFDTHRVGAANIDILFFVAKNVLLYLLKVHKIENFFGFDFEICTFS
jgi:hypothetical protein